MGSPGDQKKDATKLGVVSSVLQVVVGGLFLFFLYRYLLRQLGAESVGLWSLVVSSVSISQVAGFGISSTLVRFVAAMHARGEDKNVGVLIQTAVLFSAAVFGLLLLAGYPLLHWLLGLVVPPSSLPAALGLLPYAMVSLWFGLLATTYQSAIDGCHRVYLRNFIIMFCVTLNFISCLAIVPHWGIRGVAAAQIAQNGTALLLSAFVAKRLVAMPLIPRQWSLDHLKAILPFGAGFQLISIVQVCFDPMTKGLLSRYGGLQDVALYELASKMVVQVRLLLVNANQAMVPRIAQASVESAQGIVDIYRRSIELLVFFSLPIYSMMLINLPSISLYWIGRSSDDFILFSIILTAGWFINLVSGPSYFGFIGEGRLRWVIAGQTLIALLNLLFGAVLGYFHAGRGVVAGWGLALALGSLLVIVRYMHEHYISWRGLLSRESVLLAALCVAWGGVACFENKQVLVTNAVFLLSVGMLVWINPLRKELAGSLRLSPF